MSSRRTTPASVGFMQSACGSHDARGMSTARPRNLAYLVLAAARVPPARTRSVAAGQSPRGSTRRYVRSRGKGDGARRNATALRSTTRMARRSATGDHDDRRPGPRWQTRSCHPIGCTEPMCLSTSTARDLDKAPQSERVNETRAKSCNSQPRSCNRSN
jgi:hypothetical protein